MYVCMYVCLYVCMYVCVYMYYIYIYIYMGWGDPEARQGPKHEPLRRGRGRYSAQTHREL